MDQIIESGIKELKEKMLGALLSIGFSADGATQQVSDLGTIILASVIDKIQKENPDQNLDSDNIEDFMREKYSDEEISKMIADKSVSVLTDYLAEVTKNLSEEDKKKFLDQLVDIAPGR